MHHAGNGQSLGACKTCADCAIDFRKDQTALRTVSELKDCLWKTGGCSSVEKFDLVESVDVHMICDTEDLHATTTDRKLEPVYDTMERLVLLYMYCI